MSQRELEVAWVREVVQKCRKGEGSVVDSIQRIFNLVRTVPLMSPVPREILTQITIALSLFRPSTFYVTLSLYLPNTLSLTLPTLRLKAPLYSAFYHFHQFIFVIVLGSLTASCRATKKRGQQTSVRSQNVRQFKR